MSDLELYKFLQSDNVMDYDIRIKGKSKLYLVWLYFEGLKKFVKLMKSAGESFTESYEVQLTDDYICVDLGDFELDNNLDTVFERK